MDPDCHAPRGWAYNVIRIDNNYAAQYTMSIEGDANGTEGAPSHFMGRIVVMSEGAVVDSGTHDQLEARCEVYRDLLQATKDVDGHALRVANAENTGIG